mmetsp:Transcript_70593/g.147860  ORF Transcript_70593/g.147860 Transcript_70593/m.147860 type:complete len:165 (+) Transcript_70593:374-868(+)
MAGERRCILVDSAVGATGNMKIEAGGVEAMEPLVIIKASGPRMSRLYEAANAEASATTASTGNGNGNRTGVALVTTTTTTQGTGIGLTSSMIVTVMTKEAKVASPGSALVVDMHAGERFAAVSAPTAFLLSWKTPQGVIVCDSAVLSSRGSQCESFESIGQVLI